LRRTGTWLRLGRLACRGALLIVGPTATQFLAKGTDLFVQTLHEFFQPLVLFGKPPILFEHHRVLGDIVVAEVAEERLLRLILAFAKERRQRTQPGCRLPLLAVADHGQLDGIARCMLRDGIGQVFRPGNRLAVGLNHHVAGHQTGPGRGAAGINPQQVHALLLRLGLGLPRCRNRLRRESPHGDAQPCGVALVALIRGVRRRELLPERPLEARIKRHLNLPLLAVAPDDQFGRVAFTELRKGLDHGVFAINLGFSDGEQVIARLNLCMIGRAAGPHVAHEHSRGTGRKQYAKPYAIVVQLRLRRGSVILR